jgi:hypothetical protein
METKAGPAVNGKKPRKSKALIDDLLSKPYDSRFEKSPESRS